MSRKFRKKYNVLIIALPLMLFIGRAAIHPLFHQHREQAISISDLSFTRDAANKTDSKLSSHIRHIECVICSGLVLHAMLPETVWVAKYMLEPRKFIPHKHIFIIPARKSNYRPRAPPLNLY